MAPFSVLESTAAPARPDHGFPRRLVLKPLHLDRLLIAFTVGPPEGGRYLPSLNNRSFRCRPKIRAWLAQRRRPGNGLSGAGSQEFVDDFPPPLEGYVNILSWKKGPAVRSSDCPTDRIMRERMKL
jgi:hypothetical protein